MSDIGAILRRWQQERLIKAPDQPAQRAEEIFFLGSWTSARLAAALSAPVEQGDPLSDNAPNERGIWVEFDGIPFGWNGPLAYMAAHVEGVLFDTFAHIDHEGMNYLPPKECLLSLSDLPHFRSVLLSFLAQEGCVRGTYID